MPIRTQLERELQPLLERLQVLVENPAVVAAPQIGTRKLLPSAELVLLMTQFMGVFTRHGTPEAAIRRLLEIVGEDPDREGLQETPARVLRAWGEWASGYGQDPATVLKVFTDGAEKVDEMVVVHNIPVVSKCEHHLADITGIAHVGYIPNGRIVGLSKLPRLVEIYARRLQVQERLTMQIVDALQTVLNPVGCGIIIRASHTCMSSRGVKIHGSLTTTSAFRGAMLNKPEARAEFMAHCRDAEHARRADG